jgi:hypothetical protein
MQSGSESLGSSTCPPTVSLKWESAVVQPTNDRRWNHVRMSRITLIERGRMRHLEERLDGVEAADRSLRPEVSDMTARKPTGFVCNQEEISAVHRRPTPEEQIVIDEYREKFEACMGRIPEGLHYFPGLGPVWLGVGPSTAFASPDRD